MNKKTAQQSLMLKQGFQYVLYMQEGDIKIQLEQLQQQVKKYGGKIINQFIEARSKKIHHLPALKQAIDYAFENDAYILASNMGKKLRNLEVISLLVNAQTKQVRFYHYNPRSNLALYMDMTTLQMQSEAYVAELSETVKEKMAQMKQDGYYNKKGELKHSFGTPDPVMAGTKAGKSHKENYARFAKKMIPHIEKLEKEGHWNMARKARALNQKKIPTRYGKTWHASSVKNLLKKIEEISK